MGAASQSALFALAGSVIGALGGIVTTWLTMFAQERSHQQERVMSRRESLYGEFIDEATRVFSDALTHKLDEASKLARLYGLLSKLRLFAPAGVLCDAEATVHRVIQTYAMPELDSQILITAQHGGNLDVLKTFSEACRKDLIA
ncbi:MAG: hypothetical protein P4L90_14610 [Rhodopila sp.]|nr:hypothetical protein [Rhodopila sp.]